MFNMKAISASVVVALIGSQAMAQAVRVRETVKPKEAIRGMETVTPSAKAGNAVVEGFKAQAQPVAPANNNAASTAPTCDHHTYANKMVAGTKVSFADAMDLLNGGYLTRTTCDESGMLKSADARETLLLAGLAVRAKMNNKTYFQLTSTEKAGLDEVWAQALADAKNRNGGNTTAAIELATAQKIQTECNLRR